MSSNRLYTLLPIQDVFHYCGYFSCDTQQMKTLPVEGKMSQEGTDPAMAPSTKEKYL